jgi:outer membrane biosynthesis protein TonB
MMKAIRFIIVAVHLLFLVMLVVAPKFSVEKKKPQPLLVKTLSMKPPAVVAAAPTKPKPQKTAAAAAAPAPKKAAPVQQKPAPKKESQAPKAAPKKEPAIADKQLGKPKQPAPAKKPESRAKISDSLVKELEESIAKMDAPPAKKSKAIALMPLQIDVSSPEDESYVSLLVSHLHQALSLPDFGEVKIQLSLRQDGSVAKITVLKAQSEKNRQYLETHLPQIKFPRLEKESTFILTFCNE